MWRAPGFLVHAAIAPTLLVPLAVHAAGNGSACRLLTQAQVSAAVGVNVDAGAPVPTVRDACVWRATGSSQDSPPALQVQVLTAQDYDRIKTFRAASSSSESGLGEEARFFRDAITGGFQLIVRRGASFFAVLSWPPHAGHEQSEAEDERCKAIERTIARDLLHDRTGDRT